MRCERCDSEDLTYERDALLAARPLRVEDEVLVLDETPYVSSAEDVRIVCRTCGRVQEELRWEDWRAEAPPQSEGPVDAEEAMDRIAAHLNQPGECQGADFVDFVSRLVLRSGREIIDWDI